MAFVLNYLFFATFFLQEFDSINLLNDFGICDEFWTVSKWHFICFTLSHCQELSLSQCFCFCISNLYYLREMRGSGSGSATEQTMSICETPYRYYQ